MISLPFRIFLGLSVVNEVHSTVTDLTSSTQNSYITFILSLKSHLLVDRKVLSDSHQKLHNLIRKLKDEGLGYRKISHELNRRNIKSHQGKTFYPSLVSNIYSKMMKKDRIMSQKVVSEYRDFDIGFGVRS